MRLFQLTRRLNIFACHESGLVFIEMVVALAILGIVAVNFLTGLTTASKCVFIADESTTAESLARSQMEWVKNTDYVYGATEYSPAPIPSSKDYISYSVVIAVEPLHNPDAGIQKITVTIKHSDKGLVRLECYKRQK